MAEWAKDFWGFINSNAEGIGAIVAVLGVLGSALVWVAKRRVKSEIPNGHGRGGQGGNASVGGNGTAIGGRGGRGAYSGAGGKGGNADVAFDGIAIGGDGGDAGFPWRPALGAPSVLERQFEFGQISGPDFERDEFGFYVVGRGGHGGDLSAEVIVNGYRYPLLPLLQLLRLWSPDILEAADAKEPAGPQEFWDTVIDLAPTTAKAAEEHVRYCLEFTIPKGQRAPDPYARIRDFQ